jgi:error-prone DNA polymerase
VFVCALLNSQPLGFYSPSQLVPDAQRHGVAVRPVDVLHSHWNCTLEPADAPPPPGRVAPAPPVAGPVGLLAVRLGLRLVKNLNKNAVDRLIEGRSMLFNQKQPAWSTVEEMARMADLTQPDLDALAAADALRPLAGHRRTQVWAAAGARPLAGLFQPVAAGDDALPPTLLPEPSLAQDVVADCHTTGLSLRAHPVSFLRPQLMAERLSTAADLATYPTGRLARACGIVTVRQQPGTASGVVFVTLEDETGSVNVIVWPRLKERQRHELTRSRLLAVYGVWQRDDETGGQVRHLVAKRLRDLTPLLGALQTSSRDFH